MSQVIVLNAELTTLHAVNLHHSVRMLARGVAEVHESDGDNMIGPFPKPKVVRLLKWIYVKWRNNVGHPKYSRTNVLKRDNHTCQYKGCGKPAATLDHILPVSRGGKSEWLNAVAACQKCNFRKANKTPKEANMILVREPFIPTFSQLIG